MFGVETRAWSLTTPSAGVLARLAALPEPSRRAWLLPGALAPVVRVRRDAGGLYLRLSPGDPRRGPGSADRAYVTVQPAPTGTTGSVVEVAQRPAHWLQLVLGGIFVLAWTAAALAAAYSLSEARLTGVLGVPIVLALRSLVELGRRLDARRLRWWLMTHLTDGPAAVRPVGVRYGPARYDVPAGDCR